ncbi:aromatic compound dioxygenase [Tothia fuscella]|uniref:Aromatic compound dioxygenase n=1 Tax=Tothia fuscella TaxID=1048955 RepID=A0A9P4P2N3_9PEZI|nr:aromatic compound dioxygenase [Tothia fuscella]
MFLSNLLYAILACSLAVSAHPGHDGTTEMKMRKRYLDSLEHKGLAGCTAKLKQSGVENRIVERRKRMAEQLRKRSVAHHGEKYLRPRDWKESLKKDHRSNLTHSLQTPSWQIFEEKAAVLSPEVTEGPYYVSGEYIRKDVREKEPGVKMYIDIQLVDMNTCEPAKNVAIDFWHCNATVSASNLQNKMLRGIQNTNETGVAQFISVFPGHYTGRTNHIHILSHVNSTVNPNNTISGGKVAHISQLYFDQALISAVEQTAPYNTNKQFQMTNRWDFLMGQGSANAADPVMEYVMLGPKVEDGIFAWINFGINQMLAKTVTAAARCADGGCVNVPFVWPTMAEIIGGLRGGWRR